MRLDHKFGLRLSVVVFVVVVNGLMLDEEDAVLVCTRSALVHRRDTNNGNGAGSGCACL